MIMSEPALFADLRGTLKRDESLARHITWRCGGKADLAYVPADRDDLSVFVRCLPPTERLTVIGLGSNLLIRDGGLRGAVVLMHNPGGTLAVSDGLVYSDAGVASPKVARFAAAHGCAEAEFLAGIPGTVGGALDGIFTAAWFRFPQGDSSAARTRIKELLAKRIATQPLNLPNAGSVFRNPPNDHAARLIEGCGLKGHAIGGARVSEKHANFIVNPEGKARAADIEALIGYVRRLVAEKTGVKLDPEVQIIGEAM